MNFLDHEEQEGERWRSAFFSTFNTTLFYISSFGVILLLGMAFDVWGQIPKAQDDPETIEEAIARLIATHEAEPTSHTGDGEAIDVHRKNAVVDHPEGSILGDKFTNDDFVFQPLFEDITGYTKSTAGVTNGLGGFRLDTGSTINTLRYLRASGQYAHSYCRDDKRQTFQASVSLNSSADVLAYFGLGGFGLSGFPPGFGFKVSGGNLYATAVRWGDPDNIEVTELVTGITLTAKHFYRVQVMPEEGNAYYYVDGDLVATLAIGTNIDYDLLLFEANVKNTASAQKILSVSNIYISISR